VNAKVAQIQAETITYATPPLRRRKIIEFSVTKCPAEQVDGSYPIKAKRLVWHLDQANCNSLATSALRLHFRRRGHLPRCAKADIPLMAASCRLCAWSGQTLAPAWFC